MNRRILDRRTRLVSLYSRRADLSCIGIPQVYIRVKSVAIRPKKTVKCYGFAQTNLYFVLFCRIMTRIIVHEILCVVFLNLLLHSGKTIVDFQKKMFLKKQIIDVFWCNTDIYIQNMPMFAFCTWLLIFKGLLHMPCRYN